MSAIRFALKANRRLVTNVPDVRDSLTFNSLPELLDVGFVDSDVVFDEAGVLFSSRSRTVDQEFLQVVQQLRKQRARLFWTAPAYARADKVLREVTQGVVKCVSVFPGHDPVTPWPRARFIWMRMYDSMEMDQATQSTISNKSGNLRVLGRSIYRAAKWYDAFDSLGRVGVTPAAGRHL